MKPRWMTTWERQGEGGEDRGWAPFLMKPVEVVIMASCPSESYGWNHHACIGVLSKRSLLSLNMCLTAPLGAFLGIRHPLSIAGSLPSPFIITTPEQS